ncbi:MAG TPA: squalene--hopene cyclase [Longimicrobiales bacterium]|nr:squalene--hopene cyclase [Longimicrobiales bacterium]
MKRAAPATPSRHEHIVDGALELGRAHLLSLRNPDGHWCGDLEGDTAVEAEYALTLLFLGRRDLRFEKLANRLRTHQLSGGGWAIFPGGEPEVSASIKAYFVLKLAGDPPDADHMRRARETILALGGIDAANTYTKIYLAMFGQYPWAECPAVPPEMVLLPDWFYVNVQEMSSWSRGIFVPLSILWSHKPVAAIAPELGIAELRAARRPGAEPPPSPIERRWRAFFVAVDRGIKLLEAGGVRPLRRRALKAAEDWILDRLERTDGLAAVFPAIANTAMAFHVLGRGGDDPALRSQLEALEKLEIDHGSELQVQPSLSPVWDTALATTALRAAGLAPSDPRLVEAAAWLLDREVKRPGDWLARNPDGVIGGWYFEYANEFYPDCDDTTAVLSALAGVRIPDAALRERVDAARARGLRWLLSMQNDDGGWAAFDRACDKLLLTHVPFADHNAMIDPSCEDITGRVLETLAIEGFDRSDPAVRGAVAFLRDRQQEDGTWYGRWGCNYIYGTWLALWGLASIGEDMSRERYQRAAAWLTARQNEDGGWGESLGTYADPSRKGRGPSTASQTAWALMGLMAAGHHGSAAVAGGVAHLLETQRPDGSWDDPHWTGTGFPGVFYLRYHLYDDYFPVSALATYRRLELNGGRFSPLRRAAPPVHLSR